MRDPGSGAAARVPVLLLVPLLLLALVLAACSGDAEDLPQPPSKDDLARAATAQDAVVLLGRAERAGEDDLAGVHRAHLAALGASIPTATATGSGTASPTTTASAEPAAATLRTAEWDAAGRALASAQPVSPDLALLLTRIAAARAVDSDLMSAEARLGPVAPLLSAAEATATGTATPSSTTTRTPSAPASAASSPSSGAADTADVRALQQLLAGEHAAVFAFAVVTAQAGAADRDRAQAAWTGHVAARDALEDEIVALGAVPAAAEPAYDLDGRPSTPAEARALAVRVETNLSAVAADAVVTAGGGTRPLASSSLIEAARRVAGWTGAVEPLPGTTADPSLTTPTASAS